MRVIFDHTDNEAGVGRSHGGHEAPPLQLFTQLPPEHINSSIKGIYINFALRTQWWTTLLKATEKLPLKITSGIQQGMIWSPYLYLAYKDKFSATFHELPAHYELDKDTGVIVCTWFGVHPRHWPLSLYRVSEVKYDKPARLKG
ncbi:hypothetical protein E2C01_068529 [Portunus trituberculatus]|uniref:Uncharacterized protein n=1 Tax=Portunus trituberculatus TaxID=210409 RepID=A0A5B7HWP3_PORTR|nr:hypothetical protein [Portunus trituberculatus]